MLVVSPLLQESFAVSLLRLLWLFHAPLLLSMLRVSTPLLFALLQELPIFLCQVGPVLLGASISPLHRAFIALLF